MARSMAEYISETMWWDALGQPDWYLRLADDFKRLEAFAEEHRNEPDHKRIKGEAYALVERALKENHIPLGTNGEDFDRERRSIDTIVIHHTKNAPGMTLERLNAMHLLRIYGPHYASLANSQNHLPSKPVWSGHFYNGRQVFWGYHWLVRADGTAEQILDDHSIGWHAGNWNINTRSIGICIDDNLSNKTPSKIVIQSVSNVIQKHYTNIEPDHIIGHSDANPHTLCPGDSFQSQWRQLILDAIA